MDLRHCINSRSKTYDWNEWIGFGLSPLFVQEEVLVFNKTDVPALYADPKKANEILKWKAELSIDDMTSSSWKWEQALRKQ